jgi:hypothetical protein
MNRIIVTGLCAVVLLAFSCKEKVHEELQILIQNDTDSLIHITLYSKDAISGLYPVCKGCGGHKTTKYTLSPHDNELSYTWDEVIFLTDDLNMEPYTLVSMAFDSIHISLPDKDSVLIRFTPEKVTGYSENIFAENSTWNFRINEWNAQTQFSKNPQKDHCYSFLISKDKVITE